VHPNEAVASAVSQPRETTGLEKNLTMKSDHLEKVEIVGFEDFYFLSTRKSDLLMSSPSPFSLTPFRVRM
jgi:hypothetical protein